ncbi:MAG: hypothetical protein ACK5LL_10650 [Suipraeoptans sp.]
MAKNRYIRNIIISYMHCPDCKGVFPIPRRAGGQREKGHIKDLWCPFCKCKKKFIEQRNFDHSSAS